MPGRAIPCVEAKGLFPGRGIPVAGRGLSVGAAVAGAAGSPPELGGSATGAVGAGASAAGFGLAAAGFSTGATGTTPSSAKAALSLRATGGSMVEDGPFNELADFLEFVESAL